MEGYDGQVTVFDDAAGYGKVTDPNGTQWYFHCTAITDGTRTIAAGQRVSFRLVPGRVGIWEAAEVRPCP